MLNNNTYYFKLIIFKEWIFPNTDVNIIPCMFCEIFCSNITQYVHANFDEVFITEGTCKMNNSIHILSQSSTKDV